MLPFRWVRSVPPREDQFVASSFLARISREGHQTSALRAGQLTLTTKRFTDQYHESTLPGDAGLYDYGARWYDPRIGRFLTPDSIVPEPGNPQTLNRYSYVNNNPTNLTDPSGHCPVCIWLILVGIAFLSEGSVAEAPAGGYSDVPPNANGLAGVALVSGGAALALVGPALAPATVGALCGDGDCTNEGQAGARLAQAAQQTQSVWNMRWDQRGVAIEEALGRSPDLVKNFPMIDRFANGTATSIKSIDLLAPTYQNPANIQAKVWYYISTLSKWQGTTWGAKTIAPEEIIAREVLLAIPPGATSVQMNVLRQMQQLAPDAGVILNLVEVP